MQLPAVNFHVWKPCNYKCKFCFAVFDDVPGRLSREDAIRVVEAVAPHCDKITFVGGEPTLCWFLGDLIETAHRLGKTTCVVSNGERLRPIIEGHAASLDWIGLSVDSADEVVCVELGRGTGGHIQRSIELAERARDRGIRIKLNTVVTALTYDEDMSALVRAIRPERWKVFRVLPIAGQNDGGVEPLLITPDQFHAFIARHERLRAEGFPPVAEDNEDMTGSYVMIDPMGRFFDNVDGCLRYSEPILEVGVERAFASVRWDRGRFEKRDGLYQWRRARRG